MAILYEETGAKAHKGAAIALRALGRESLAAQHEARARELEQ